MLLIYSLVLMVLGLARWLWAKHASALEKKYSRFSTQLMEAAREPSKRPGNGNLAEASLAVAKRQFELGRLVQKRDRLEARYHKWQSVADRLGRWMSALLSWKGKKLPYTLGALDVWLALSLVDMFGMSQYVNARSVFEWVVAQFQG